MKKITYLVNANRLLLLALLLSLAACSNNTRATPESADRQITRTNAPVLAPSPTLTQSPLSTTTPTLTSTWTVTPTRTLYRTPLPTVTLTPLPPTPTNTNRSKAEVEKQILHLLSNNGGCRLPCWWGFIPGQTNWITMRDFFAQNGWTNRYSAEKQELVASFEIKPHRFTIWGDVFIEGSNTEIIRFAPETNTDTGQNIYDDPFFMDVTAYYGISNLLKEYGPPDDVRIYFDPPLPSANTANHPNFSIVLFYLQNGFAVEYSGRRDSQPNGIFQACGRNLVPVFSLWSPMEKISTSKAYTRLYKGSLSSEASLELFELYKSLEEATSITLDEFYTRFQDPNACLESPEQIWERK